MLSEAARALQSEHDPERILTVIADQLEAVVPIDSLTIYAADFARRTFRPLLARGPEAAQVMAHQFSLDQGLNGWGLRLGEPQLVNNAGAHPAAGQVPGTQLTDQSMLLIPLVAGDRRLGMLNCVRARNDAFTAADLEGAALLGHMAASAWRNAQLYAELAEHAVTDPLTGLLNTRWLREIGGRELAQSARAGRPLAILLVDLDHFKVVNDTAGHAAGDAVLQGVAAALRRLIRAGDAAVRYGGEEFILLLRDADVEGAGRIAAAIGPAVAALPPPPGCSLPAITASVGVAVFPDHGRTLDSLLRAADVAMYQAKRAGRNRTRIASPPAAGVPEPADRVLRGAARPAGVRPGAPGPRGRTA